MTTTGPGSTKFDPSKKSHIAIGLEPGGKSIEIYRETFWVKKNEVVEWYCDRTVEDPTHKHSQDCFTVKFDKDGSPFKNDTFTSDANGYACSGAVNAHVSPDVNKKYRYTVSMNGKADLDPRGGVQP